MLITCAMCSNSNRQFMKMVVSLLELLVKQMSPWFFVCRWLNVDLCAFWTPQDQWSSYGTMEPDCATAIKNGSRKMGEMKLGMNSHESLQENDQRLCTYRLLISMAIGVYNVSLSIATKLYQKWVIYYLFNTVHCNAGHSWRCGCKARVAISV